MHKPDNYKIKRVKQYDKIILVNHVLDADEKKIINRLNLSMTILSISILLILAFLIGLIVLLSSNTEQIETFIKELIVFAKG